MQMHLERHWEESQGLHWKPGVHWLSALTLRHGSHKYIYTAFVILLLNIIMVNLGTSLVVQFLGVHLPIQGAGVWFLVREDPACHGTTKPCSTATESQQPRAHAQDQEKPPNWEALALQWQRPSTARNKLKREFKEKSNTSFRWYFKWHEADTPWKKKSRKR